MLASQSVGISARPKDLKSNNEFNVLQHYWEGQEPIIIKKKKSISMKHDKNKKPLISYNYRSKKRMH